MALRLEPAAAVDDDCRHADDRQQREDHEHDRLPAFTANVGEACVHSRRSVALDERFQFSVMRGRPKIDGSPIEAGYVIEIV